MSIGGGGDDVRLVDECTTAHDFWWIADVHGYFDSPMKVKNDDIAITQWLLLTVI